MKNGCNGVEAWVKLRRAFPGTARTAVRFTLKTVRPARANCSFPSAGAAVKEGVSNARVFRLGSVAAVLLVTPVVASAQVLYLDNFDTDTSINWAVNARNPGNDVAEFAFDYSSVGIPPAPGSGGTTLG